MKNILNKFTIIVICSAFSILLPIGLTNAGDDVPEINWFEIMPEISNEDIDKLNTAIAEIWSTGWHVWDNYNKNAEQISTEDQITSWIMNWNTIMNYLVFFVQFLSQLWLVVWAAFIIYAWYKYMTNSFWWKSVPSATIRNAIIWILIVIFSYAIMRTLTSFIGLT